LGHAVLAGGLRLHECRSAEHRNENKDWKANSDLKEWTHDEANGEQMNGLYVLANAPAMGTTLDVATDSMCAPHQVN
jgi:hypothetical protein